jgi:hypothetical protein
MKIKVKKVFRYQDGPRKVREIQPGIYSVPGEISRDLYDKIRKFGKVEVVVEEKKAPEDKMFSVPKKETKVLEVREYKSKVGRKTKRSRSSGAKSDA